MNKPFQCDQCSKRFKTAQGRDHHARDAHSSESTADIDTTPDWTRGCDVCGQKPIVPATGMCGPCTFGEADTIGGNW